MEMSVALIVAWFVFRQSISNAFLNYISSGERNYGQRKLSQPRRSEL